MSLLALAATEELAPLWLPSWAFPLIGAIGFFALGFICWSFRDVANRHALKVQRAGGTHGTDQH